MKKLSIKQHLYRQCQAHVNNRLKTIQNTIAEIEESLTSETKSSAGDKHETGRAMLQLEREKAGRQLAEIERTQQILFKISLEKRLETVGVGSVVYTSQNNYFIAVSAGEMVVDNDKFYAVSAMSPIGEVLTGKTIGDQVAFRNQFFTVTNVF